MDRPPRDRDEPVIGRRILLSIGIIGGLMALMGLPLFFYGLELTEDIVVAQTVLFTFLVLVQMAVPQLVRSRFDLSPLSNRWLIAAIASSILLQLAVLYTPVNDLFDVVPVGTTGWTWIGAALVAFLVAWFMVASIVNRWVAE
jgi:Ca2+-transporting ATPase